MLRKYVIVKIKCFYTSLLLLVIKKMCSNDEFKGEIMYRNKNNLINNTLFYNKYIVFN